MSYTGIVQDGKVLLPPEANLPSGTKVRVEPIGASVESPTPAPSLEEFIGIFDDLPRDFAKNHDHYIHGTPKR